MDRFADPALRHRTTQVAMDGSQKLPYRLLRTIGSRLAAGERTSPRLPGRSRLDAVRHRRGQRQWRAAAPGRPPGGSLRSVVASASTPAAIVPALLSLREVFPPDLAEDRTFRALLTDDLDALSRLGAAAVVDAVGRETIS